MAAQTAVTETDDDYSTLKDVRIGVDRVEGPFSLCLWIYLSEPVCPPATIIQQATIPIFCFYLLYLVFLRILPFAIS